MGKRKYIIAAAIFSLLGTAISVAEADTVNSLLQMDVKKSSVADTVDVTFYTTGNSQNSVVTRKANNKYVVLLPGTSSSASVAPGIGGVKDLITDIDVKHVNDGMGGYTKVTFGTTKPINIKTYMQKTNPLTQAQKDSQAIIAKNNVASTQAANPQQQTQTQVKPVSNTTQTKTTQNSNNTQPKPAVQSQSTKKAQPTAQKTSIPEKLAQAPKIIPIEFPKPKSAQAKAEKVKAEKTKVEKNIEPKVQEKSVQTQTKAQTPIVAGNDGYVPKMKFDENGKRLIDLEPRVSHAIVQEKNTETAENEIQIIEEDAQPQVETDTAPIVEEMPQNQEEPKSHFPIWILIAGGAVLTLGLMYLVIDAFMHATKKDKSRLESFHNMSVQNQAKRRRREYYEIVDNKDLSWQEKYKLYSEKEKKRQQKNNANNMSYVTDISGAKKAVVMSSQVQPSVNTNANPQQKVHEQVVREKLQAKVSQMEHSLAQTPTMKEPENVSNEVKSEDTAIMNKMNDIKLKSFSKPTTLKETQRTLAEEEKEVSRNKSYKEGRFVKLKNSPLSVALRKSVASELEASDLIGTGNKYLTNNGVRKMNKEKENYLVSSLDEYLSILDTETTSPSAIAKPRISQAVAQKSSESQVMSRSGVTNPIAKASSPIESKGGKKPLPYMNGLIVKSGYNIDSEKGFYLVNIDGVSALVGRIKDSIFVLKKFDSVVDKQLQVRPDDANVYIVRVGKFKCLVDVSKDKMGTLIEI